MITVLNVVNNFGD